MDKYWKDRGYYKIKNYVNCDYIITNTNDLKDFVIESGWDSKGSIYTKFYKRNNHSKKEKKNSSKIILCLGRFHRNKGIDILLKAMPYLNDYNLWIVGEGEEENFMI